MVHKLILHCKHLKSKQPKQQKRKKKSIQISFHYFQDDVSSLCVMMRNLFFTQNKKTIYCDQENETF